MISFRTATLEDIAPMAALWTAGWHEAHAAIVPAALTDLRTLDSFTDRLMDDLLNSRVGFVDGRLAGFHIAKDGEVYQFYVDSFARGSGFAAAMLADAEQMLAHAGVKIAWLACSVGNDRAAAFYSKAGWRNTGLKTINVDTSSGAFPLEIWRFEKAI